MGAFNFDTIYSIYLKKIHTYLVYDFVAGLPSHRARIKLHRSTKRHWRLSNSSANANKAIVVSFG